MVDDLSLSSSLKQPIPMNRSFYRNLGLLGAALALFVLSQLLQYVSFNSLNAKGRVRRFEKTFQQKELLLYSIFEELEEDQDQLGGPDYFTFLYPQIMGKIKGRGMDVFLFLGDTLVLWTGNTVSPADFDAHKDLEIVFLGNNWSVKKERVSGALRMVGLIKIKNEYPYENVFLENGFQEDFRVPPGTRILPEPVESGYPVHDSWQNELFSLDFSGEPEYSLFQSQVSLLLYFLGIFLFLLYVRRLIRSISDRTWKNIGIFLAAVILILMDAILMKIPVAPNMAGMDIFNPRLFAASDILPSLGDLLITSFFVFFLVYIFYYEFRLGDKHKGRVFQVLQLVFFLALVLYFQGIALLFRSLVVHSSISFETYRVLDISVFTFIGLFILAMHFAAFTLLLDKFFSLFRKAASGRWLGLYVLAFGLLSWLAGYLLPGGPDPVLIILIMGVAGIIAIVRSSGRVPMRYSTYILLIFLFSVISVYQVRRYSNEKRHNEKLVLAVDLSAEHDPVAELLLKNMEAELEGDQELAYLIHEGYTDHLVIDDYLRGNYFSGFWEKYDMHFTLCSPYDSLYVEPFIDTWYPCYQFFEELYADSRFRIPGSRFYFVDNINGRISYFGGFTYYSADSTQEASLFLELDLRLVTAELGYPELLLRDRPRKGFFTQDYSYAKYSHGQLITQNGNYSYSLKPDPYSSGKAEFEYSAFDGYEHLAYNLDENNTIVVSNPKISLLNLAITFTYIFVFFYLIVTLYLLALNIPFLKSSLQPNIKNKIQYTMIGILLLSLLLIGGGTILFSIRQYKERHYAILAEKIQSVYIELIHKLEFENELDRDWQEGGYLSLDELLEKFSNVFFTDINLYDPQGELLATSRAEVFENRLLGPRIHPAAYRELTIRNAAEYVQEETIGSLRYLSAYVPFRNNQNKLLAYLNLPYFTRQRVLTMEISNLVVAIVNFYVLLITVSILIAVFISSQITQPLRMLQSKFGKITFGVSNEKIRYDAKDEIGGLVREYNHMVDQLAVSAEKLARSERESAWREMAKQIAHEIKNPLTPMKLSVQHLQRSIEKDPGKQRENIQRITRTLIDQIDNLSMIATEFSNFAKMPRANNEEVDLEEKLGKISELFLNSEQTEIETSFDLKKPAIVFADPEQLSRVFINLLKNAIQSVPEDREGKIGISLETDGDKARVKVMDNGRGIPGDLSDKLFQPNFTTKSSGMGMGLAIVKSIVENAGGSVRYETELGKGTTFIVELPLLQKPPA
jgi:two-component system nitrogen regulation sensor histidine kinase NtrY